MAILINNRIHFTAKEVAERQNVALSTVYHWLATSSLSRTRVADVSLIAEEDLIQFLAKKVDRRKKGWQTWKQKKS
jgi:predicted site-specific integrase-resolvase